MAQVLKDRGYSIVSGGTDNHLFLLSLIQQGLTGKAAEAALEHAYMTTNKNSVPNDPQSPFITSGLRIGTPAMTTRGFKTAEAQQVASWIADILDDIESVTLQEKIQKEVLKLCKHYPVYG